MSGSMTIITVLLEGGIPKISISGMVYSLAAASSQGVHLDRSSREVSSRSRRVCPEPILVGLRPTRTATPVLQILIAWTRGTRVTKLDVDALCFAAATSLR